MTETTNTPDTPDYEVTMYLQEWRNGPYDGAGSGPLYPVAVVAKTRQEAIDEAARTMGTLPHGYHWRATEIKITDLRLVKETAK